MKRKYLVLSVVFAIAACTANTPVLQIDDLWAEREKSKAEFHKKYAGKEIVVAGRYRGTPESDFRSAVKGYFEIAVSGSSLEMIKCEIEEKEVASSKSLVGKGEGIAVKGKLASEENDPYPLLRPCSLDLKK